MAKFKFDQKDLDDMIVKALNEQPAKPETAKPNVMQKLLARSQIKGKQ